MKRFMNFGAALIAVCLAFTSCGGNTAVTVEPVTFSEESGELKNGTTVIISTETDNATIYYSTDKIVYPTNYSTAGTAGVEGASSASVKIKGETGSQVTLSAVAVDASGNCSTSKKVKYTILESCLSTEENGSIYLGNPSNAKTDETMKENYLLERTQYSMSYNDTKHIPNWVAWHLDADNIGSVERSDEFHADEDLPDSFYAVKDSDFQYSTYKFDRGHMCPSGERTDTAANNYATFSMANMVPQTGNNNEVVWMYFESFERSLALAGNEVYIYCGPLGQGGSSSAGSFNYIGWASSNTDAPSDSGIVVPAYTWKVIIALTKGTDDVDRIDSTATCIAVIMPNTTDCFSKTGYTSSNKEDCWKYYVTTVDDIEEKTGYDFFAELPDSVENVLEAQKYGE